jgi:hypothetical protein
VADEPPAGRLRAFKRGMVGYAAFPIVAAIVIAVTVDIGTAFLAAVFSGISGVAMWGRRQVPNRAAQMVLGVGELPDDEDD